MFFNLYFYKVDDVKKDVQELYDNIDTRFPGLYDDACRMAQKVGTEPSKPRIAKRQMHRSNAPADSISDHYKINVAKPFLSHVIENLNLKFTRTFLRILYFYLFSEF